MYVSYDKVFSVHSVPFIFVVYDINLFYLCYTILICAIYNINLFPHNTQAFNMIDQNRDGFIDAEDLKDMLASLGELFCIIIVVPLCQNVRL